jgi:uncharacterized protein (TIGR00288 family)
MYPGSQPFHPAPNAALLIDFDNVTMGIRSDLGKELKALLNSEVIRGKVAVQRAYADWRRYPQYIVPLAESSIDLIFAPAYGSSKKNATDLRMAIDAMELVFTRPEIGTFILMTGDSDFSSCVLKLKEYGKYVIGVGMRESSSDLLIQNCDEYYSYHALSGLTRAGEDEGSREDPWTLVQLAAKQMAANRDAMRTDRLKQVMLDIDPGFDEKKLGYSKFSRFVSEAAGKGLLRLKKLENGQHEIVVDGDEPQATSTTAPVAEAPRERERSRDRGRGRGRREAPAAEPAAAAAPPASAPEAAAATVEPQEVAAATSAAVDAPADLQHAYALLQQAVRALGGSAGGGVRDGDVKRRMLELSPNFDESTLGFPKFSQFLRQAHDEEVIDLNRVGNGHYEVALSPRSPRLSAPAPGTEAPAQPAVASPATAEAEATPGAAEAATEQPAATASRPPVGALRGRRGGRSGAEGPPPILPGQVIRPPVAPAAKAEEAPERKAPQPEPEAETTSSAEPTVPPAEEIPDTPPKTRRGRRGTRGRRTAEDAPPPILSGQVVEVPDTEGTSAAEPEPEAATSAEAAATENTESAAPKRRRSRSRKGAAAPKPEKAPAAPVEEEAAAPVFSAADLGLPRDPGSIQAYLTNSYRGVGKKTAEALLDAFGDNLFQIMQEDPQRVRDVLGDRRADALLEQWSADYDRRATPDTSSAPATDADVPAAKAGDETAGDAADDETPPRTQSRGRRGGRGRGQNKKGQPTPA